MLVSGCCSTGLAMATDDLSAPLGQNQPRKRWPAVRLPLLQYLVAGLGLLVLVVGAWTLTAANPIGRSRTTAAAIFPVAPHSGNEPVKTFAETPGPVSQIAQTPAERSPINAPAPAPADRATVSGSKTVTIIDGTSGRRQEIVIPGRENLTDSDQPPGETVLRNSVPKTAPGKSSVRNPPAR